ncbi:galactoside 2-alpha-L-fucosyltransferase-like [Euphorbia lathyris]|uniref:galactoside 2-alpha-L-fucosyltransferase-like n=1 Tax=Euphorbia lathyris TaxID=212925 RepID=UPI00331448CD
METKHGFCTMKIITLIACLVAFPSIIMLSENRQDRMFDLIELAKLKIGIASGFDSSQPEDFSLGGLLASGFDPESCLSRSQSVHYCSPSSKKPSAYLVSKLRDYENLHKKCGPDTESYNRTVRVLDSRNVSSATECNYIVWIAHAGLGNRMLTMASAFLYALLTRKVLLVEHNSDMSDLFCEPFPDTSWLLPPGFPMKKEIGFNRWNPNTLGNKLRNKMFNASTAPTPSYMYLFLASGATFLDKLVYCEEYQDLLQRVQWLILRSDEYFVPSLFLMPSFREELDRMFPDKESVFHHLGRYLFHPSNKAWGLITRFYESYLTNAKEIIGLQIRVFNPKNTSFPSLMDQILACTTQENLLPKVDTRNLNLNIVASPSKNRTSKAVIITSLYSEFYANITDRYLTFPTTTEDVIAVYQASHEEHQVFGNSMHNVKAWVEIYLLSLSNVLVTSSASTFGYVAQGLGGLKPWLLYRPETWNKSEPACHQAMSMEPCLHIPPNYDCKKRAWVDMGNVVSYVRHCEDVTSGLKLISNFTSSS